MLSERENAMYKVVTCATLSEKEAEKIADLLLDNNLAACVQIINIKSRFKWQGLREKDDEYLLVIKTRSDKYPAIQELIRRNHSYRVPEIIGFNVTDIFPPYADWINESVES